MKTQKKLNILLIVLIIVLISLVSFVGVFYQNRSEMINRMPNYILGTNVSGYRRISLTVAEEESSEPETKTETVSGEEGNSLNENTTSEQATNSEKINKYNVSDYKKSADIIKSRLKSLKVEDFTVALDENTGKLDITIPENDQTDVILSDISQKGNFQIVDNVTNEVLLSNNDVKNVDVHQENNLSYSTIYMNIRFNSKGSKKLKNVTANYQNDIIDEKLEDNEAVGNEALENVDSSEISSSEGDSQPEESPKTRQVSIKIDDTTMLTTYFSEIVDNGVLPLTIGTSADEDEIRSSLLGGNNLAAIIENEAMPLQYEIVGNIYIQSNVATNKINIIIYIEVGLAIIVLLYGIIRYKLKGLLSAILLVGYLAILLIVIRFANVVLSLEGILGIELVFIINSVFNYLLLKSISDKDLGKEETINRFDKIIKNYAFSIVPIAILSIICCFVNWNALYSFGTVVFWGIVISIIYNLTVTNLCIRNK